MTETTPRDLMLALIGGTDTWSMIDSLCDERPPGVVEAARLLLHEAEGQGALTLVRLLAHWGGDAASQALVDCLRLPDPPLVAAALEHLNRLRVRVPASLVAPLLAHADHGVLLAALSAAGHTGDRGLVDALAEWLHVAGEAQARAAVALGRIGATEHACSLAIALPYLDDQACEAYLLSLELMADPAVIPAVVRWLETAEARWVQPIGHLLWCLTTLEPHEEHADTEAQRAAWLRLMRSDQPDRPALAIRGFAQHGPRMVSFGLVGGQSQVYTAYDHADPAALVRWSRSLYVGGQRLFDIGNDGNTCEAMLTVAGWSPERAHLAAIALDRAVRDLSALDEDAIESCLPLLSAMRSGRYVASLLDVPIERIEHPHASWMSRRRQVRAGSGPVDLIWAHGPDAAAPPPDLVHYQTPMAIGMNPPFVSLMMPSQPTAKLEATRAGEVASRIVLGERPVIVALGWVDDRVVGERVASRLLEMAVMDGHHRLEAYARAGVPARVLALCRVEDSWGPPTHPERHLRGCFEALGASAGA